MRIARPAAILPHMEPALPVAPFVTSFASFALGTYVVLASLALTALDGVLWGLALLPAGVVLFAVAALPARAFVHRR